MSVDIQGRNKHLHFYFTDCEERILYSVQGICWGQITRFFMQESQHSMEQESVGSLTWHLALRFLIESITHHVILLGSRTQTHLVVGGYCKSRQESKKKKKKKRQGNISSNHVAMTPGELKGCSWLYRVSQALVAPLALVISLSLRDQLLIAPKTSVSTKLLASFPNFCICGSCFLVFEIHMQEKELA